MKKVLTGADIEQLLQQNMDVEAAVANAVLTPSARDVLRDRQPRTPARTCNPHTAEPIVPDYTYKWTPGTDAKTPAEIEAFFHSAEIETLKERMCDIGRRMWQKDYTDGNGGNLTVRVGDNLYLCTPTLVSKGFMRPEQIALIDVDGTQLAGKFKRTSEAMTHMAIFKAQPKARACCHAHPPYATAFAVAKVRPPTCLIPEAEVFLGEIGMAEYQTPGTPENAAAVGAVAAEHMAILMLNHGVITWGKDIEDAYWKMENTDAYCKTVWVASQLGNELTPITGQQAKELIAIRKTLGMEDKRENWKECELCDNSDFRPGFYAQPANAHGACPVPETAQPSVNPEAEAMIKAITAEILKQLEG